MLTIDFANFLASSISFIKAPDPALTSKIIPSESIANFLLIILEAIKDISSTVAVRSLKAYIFLSAGAIFAVWPATAIPVLFAILIKSSVDREVLNPGIDSNLSIVPPVCPKPLPDNFDTVKPSEATIGASVKVVLSPTPPVECLSIFFPFILSKETLSPLFNIVIVKLYLSSSLI